MHRICLVYCLSFLVACAATPKSKVTPKANPTAAKKDNSVGILVYGRSVTENWFRFRGVAAGRGYKKGRYRLLHSVFEPYQPSITKWPTQITSDLARFGKHVRAIHYKLCFVDFKEDTKVSDYLELAREIYQGVVAGRKKLFIIGNALPLVAADNSASIGAKLRAYNAMLQKFAAKHPNQVYIFDQYALLADDSGALNPKYAVSKSDSHLNFAAYQMLEKAYFAFLDDHFATLP